MPQRVHDALRTRAVAKLSLACQAVVRVKHFQRATQHGFFPTHIQSVFGAGATFNFAQKIFRFWNDLQERLAKDPGNACAPAISGNAATNFF